MKSQCLPFIQIPHTSKLFADFLSYSPKVHEFYPRSPKFGDWFRQAAGEIEYDSTRRESVCDALLRQNLSWNASSKTIENIERMRGGAAALVTGQQVGLFGGPLFSSLKALTAVKLADEATQGGVDCVPVFWLATEDHDLEEVNHITVPGSDGSLHSVLASSTGLPNSPVGSIKFGSEIEETVKQIAELLGESAAIEILRESYRPEETFGTAFARLFSGLFAEWGVIMLDASDPELHRIAEPIYRQSTERAAEIHHALDIRGKALEAAGYETQVKVSPSSTLLFAVQNGARIPVQRQSSAGPDQFVIGDEKLSQTQILDRIRAAPENFSPNVLLRPVVQDYLLPTLTYAGGAAEIAYFAQTAEVYKVLLGKITAIVPRFSATLVDTKLQHLLERYRLGLPDVFHGPEQLRETLGIATLPPSLNQSFEETEKTLNRAMSTIREALERLDKTLVDSAHTAESKMLYQLNGLRSKAARAELRHSETLGRHAEFLGNALYPGKALQDREIAGIYFLAQHGTALLQDLYNTYHPDCLDHQVIKL